MRLPPNPKHRRAFRDLCSSVHALCESNDHAPPSTARLVTAGILPAVNARLGSMRGAFCLGHRLTKKQQRVHSGGRDCGWQLSDTRPSPACIRGQVQPALEPCRQRASSFLRPRGQCWGNTETSTPQQHHSTTEKVTALQIVRTLRRLV